MARVSLAAAAVRLLVTRPLPLPSSSSSTLLRAMHGPPAPQRNAFLLPLLHTDFARSYSRGAGAASRISKDDRDDEDDYDEEIADDDVDLDIVDDVEPWSDEDGGFYSDKEIGGGGRDSDSE